MNTYQQAKERAVSSQDVQGQIGITPLLHTYTVYFDATQEKPDHWYIESTEYGDERAMTIYCDDSVITDCDGSLNAPSDLFIEGLKREFTEAGIVLDWSYFHE
jgi:hypothetical protein